MVVGSEVSSAKWVVVGVVGESVASGSDWDGEIILTTGHDG